MAVITIGTTGATWGLTAETGVLVQTYSQKVSREKNEVRDAIGDVALVSYFNPLAKISFSAVLAGTTGVATAAPGVAQTFANIAASNGSPTGGVYIDDVELSYANTEFKKISGSATRYQFS